MYFDEDEDKVSVKDKSLFKEFDCCKTDLS